MTPYLNIRDLNNSPTLFPHVIIFPEVYHVSLTSKGKGAVGEKLFFTFCFPVEDYQHKDHPWVPMADGFKPDEQLIITTAP